MIKYSLWVEPLKDVRRYELSYLALPKVEQKKEENRQKYPICTRLAFMVEGKKKEKFSLEEIDSLVARCQNESQLLKALAETKYQYPIRATSHLIATYKINQQIKEAPLVFNSPLLAKYAYKVRKNQKEGRKTTILEESEDLEVFCGELLALARDNQKRQYIIQSRHSEEFSKLSFVEQTKLKKYLPNGKHYAVNGGYHDEYTVKEALLGYIQSYDINKKKHERGEVSFFDDFELEDAERQVYKTLRQNYKTLRNTILFVQTLTAITSQKERFQLSVDQKVDAYKRQYSLSLEGEEKMKEYYTIEEENEDLLKKFAEEKKQQFDDRYQEDAPTFKKR